MEALRFICDKEGVRLDKYLSEQCKGFSRSYIQKLIAENNVVVNNNPAKASLRLNINDKITLTLPPPITTTAPEDIPLSIIYQDDDLLVIDKPAGLVVYPTPGHPSHTGILAGANDHHKAESLFKALGRALDAATGIDERVASDIPSTKDVLEH